MRKPLALFLILSLATAAGSAHEEKGNIRVEEIEKSTLTWSDTPLPAYPAKQPEVTVFKITIPPKTKLPWHKHPVINCGYMLEGELHVTAEDGRELELRQGEALIELVNEWHYGENKTDEPAVILVFYAGGQGEKITVLKEDVAQ